MSILKDPYVVPSRVKGVVRYLLAAKGQREKRETLEALLSPKALVSRGDDRQLSRKMVQATIRECIKMGLVEESEDGSEVAINPKLNLKENVLPSALAQLLLNTPELTENHDFARVLAWYMAQDFFVAPGNWAEAQKKLRDQVGEELLELNDARFGQFEDWSCYLGFGWRNTLSGNPVLVPDPTAYIRQSLSTLFEGVADKNIPFGEFINRLGKYCPVFETGTFREKIDDQLGDCESNYLSSVTSVTLRRLEEEGKIKLERLSDITVSVLQDGVDSRISHITWIDQSVQGEEV
ncbi:hypothetical protein C7293_00215 [filamentous cyanobacterium CCT1]|nr:hypothetical protein C7293_00215 [filamentous cyanobacterium CCT1]PSN81465.1 hypothetical protein C8B47_01155 [filamentous cyanobacterium CCP4]